ncbi:LAFA_0F04478g1_1 [Lachancea sp. 'fantastica']|nr:LAFA_0F04478g1_1 [Lachancea sp. 'fantastica']
MDERSRDDAEHEVKRSADWKGGYKKKTGAKKLKNEAKGPTSTGGSGNAKSKKKFKRNKEQPKVPPAQHKVVVRLLPPDLTSELFFETLHKELGSENGSKAGAQFLADNVDSQYYVQGHYSRKPFKLPTYSRAYLTFFELAKLQEFQGKIKNLKFTDDSNTSMVPVTAMSPYVKRLRNDDRKGAKNHKANLEGTIEKDKTFQTFLKSMALMNENKEEFGYADLSVIQPLQKALDRKREEEARIKNQGERAVIALAGEGAKEKTKKNKTKSKTKSKNKKSVGEVSATKKKNKSGRAPKGASDKQNMVIIEEAGRRELQRRDRVKKMEKKGNAADQGLSATNNADANAPSTKKPAKKKPKAKKKPQSRGKKKTDPAEPGSSSASTKTETGGQKAEAQPKLG